MITKIIQLFILFSIWGCSQPKNNLTTEYQPIKFQINSELLSSNSIIINEFEFQKPKEWKEISSEQIITLEKVFAQDSLLNVFTLINGQSNGTSLLLIAESDLINKPIIVIETTYD